MVNTKRSETGHWVTGSAYDFLGLTAEESAYVDLKLRLSKALRDYRTRQSFSQSALAKKLRSSQSRVAKMERGDPSVTIDLLLRGLILLGVTRSEIARVLVFEEPKPFVVSATAATADFNKSVYWSSYKFSGRSFTPESIKTNSSGKDLHINNLIQKDEVAYG